MGLVGALIGTLSAQGVARKARESDRRKRCVDRVLAALSQLDTAYADYVSTADTGASDDLRASLPVQGALRSYNQAVQLLHIPSLRTAAMNYRDRLTDFYLVYGEPPDPLDAGRQVLTLQQLNAAHIYLSDKLRGYEST